MKAAVDLGREDATCPARWHGTVSAYRQRTGCRCPHAVEAVRVYVKRRKTGRLLAGHVDGMATARRLRALAAIGWRFRDIGDLLDVSHQAVRCWATFEHPTVLRSTQARVLALYVEMSGTSGPSSQGRARALAKGWAPPAAWVGVDMSSWSSRPDWSRFPGHQQRKGQAA